MSEELDKLIEENPPPEEHAEIDEQDEEMADVFSLPEKLEEWLGDEWNNTFDEK